MEISEHGVLFTMKCMSSGGRSTQTIYPSSKLAYKRHILEMPTNPQHDFYCPQLCRLSCKLIISTPPKIPLPSAVFWACKTPMQQEAQLSPSDRAMHLVSSNLADCHTTVQKLLIRQVLTKLIAWSWRFSQRQCVMNHVHSTMTRPSRLPLSQVS